MYGLLYIAFKKKPHLETIEKAINSDNKKDNSYVMIKESWSLLSIITSKSVSYLKSIEKNNYFIFQTDKDQLNSKENCLIFLKNSQDLNLIVRLSKCLNKRLYTGVYLNMIGVLVCFIDYLHLVSLLFKFFQFLRSICLNLMSLYIISLRRTF